MLKIGIISMLTPELKWASTEHLWAEFAEGALKLNHEVFILKKKWKDEYPPMQDLLQKGAKIIARHRKRNYWLYRIMRKILSLLNKEYLLIYYQSDYSRFFRKKYNIVLISQCKTTQVSMCAELMYYLKKNKVHYFIVCQVNSDNVVYPTHIRQSNKRLYDNALGVAFVSKHNYELSERQLASKITKAYVVQNPVNLPGYEKISFPKTDKIYFAIVARLDMGKGHDILFETLGKQIWKNRNWQCNVYGRGNDLTCMKDLIQHYNISDKVEFAGHVKDVKKIWQKNHILLLPSRFEGTPLALVEAMVCGRPSVVTDVGGNREWLEEGKTGFIAEGPTAYSFGKALEKAWQGRSRWEEMGEQAHRVAMRKKDITPGKTLLNIVLQEYNEVFVSN